MTAQPGVSRFLSCTPSQIRTGDLQIRSLLLYPLSYGGLNPALPEYQGLFSLTFHLPLRCAGSLTLRLAEFLSMRSKEIIYASVKSR